MAFIWDKNTGKIGPALVKVSSSPSYTLGELRQLARQHVDELPRHIDGELIPHLAIGRFLEWLAKREQGKGDER